MKKKVSVIIVNFNSESTIGNCLQSIYRHTAGADYEIIVVDNASEQASIKYIKDHFPGIKLIQNNKNKGFGTANNIGAGYASGEYLFFLNPDTLLQDNAIERFIRFMEKEQPDAASCGGCLITKDGDPTTSWGNFPSFLQELGSTGFSRFFRWHYEKIRLGKACENEKHPFQVPFITGADIFIRKKIFHELGGFDESFFLYYEETDLFYRLHKAGYKSYILPDVKIVHLEGTTLLKEETFNYKTWSFWEKSRYYYFRKHRGAVVAGMVKTMQTFSFVIQKITGNRTFQLKKVLKITWRA